MAEHFAPADIKSIYGLSATSLDGTGQTLALFELDGFTRFRHYPSMKRILVCARNPSLFIGVDGQTNTPGNGAVEVTAGYRTCDSAGAGLIENSGLWRCLIPIRHFRYVYNKIAIGQHSQSRQHLLGSWMNKIRILYPYSCGIHGFPKDGGAGSNAFMRRPAIAVLMIKKMLPGTALRPMVFASMTPPRSLT